MTDTTPRTKKEKELAKSWKSRTLPVILNGQEPVDKVSKSILVQADEDKLIFKYKGSWSFLYIAIVCLFISSLFIFTDKIIELKLTMLSLGLFGLWMLILFFTVPKKQWVFNRRTQVVTVPGRYYKKGHDIPLDQMRIETRMSGSGNTGVTRVYPVAIVPSNLIETVLRINIISLETLGRGTDLYKLWSYYVWYMDENRPLPPGKIFDHCREREFNDRKKGGFPLPMYYSLIPTPEATPEFQKQRDEKWTDEMFCPDVNKYGECSLEPGKLNFPEPLLFYNPKNNPENWERIKFEDPSNFKYTPEVKWVRYVFDRKKVVYTLNMSDRILVPPKGSKYTTEYFRSDRIDIKPYYEKELKELREKEGQGA